ncbi:MAG: IS3 family transposase [Clostridia bacterium]|nr:IS3 family transposase [Clostridia bacterium]
MRAKIKYDIIYKHRGEYPVRVMCRYFGVSKSGYYDYVKRIGREEKDAQLAEKIKQHQEHCFQTYGYRRMHIWLEKQGIHHNPKTILRVMKKYGLLAEIRRRRKWQNLGQQIHRYENLLNRQFSADRPNSKWVTDISYIHTKEGILYLSMIRDLYDNSIVAYKTAASQTVNLVLDTIRLAMRRKKKKVAAELQLHSDQGFQYTSQAYFKLTQSYRITPSMSRRGNPFDNIMAENFFSILKTECIYRHKPSSLREANSMIDRYIDFYNNERIQTEFGVAPLSLRHSV